MQVVLLQDGLEASVTFADAQQIGDLLEEAGHGVDVADGLDDVGLVEEQQFYGAELVDPLLGFLVGGLHDLCLLFGFGFVARV